MVLPSGSTISPGSRLERSWPCIYSLAVTLASIIIMPWRTSTCTANRLMPPRVDRGAEVVHSRLMGRHCLISAVLLIVGCTAATEQRVTRDKPEFLNSPEAAARNRPFSEAVRAGDFLFLAGQLGTDPASGKLVAGGIVPESRQTLENVKAVLEQNAASLADVVKCTVFLAEMAEWSTFNGVYTQFFSKPYPARSAFGANGLALNARVELECVAFVPQGRR